MPGTQQTAEVRLDLEGMTCAACASRIEKRLNELDGVAATVNLATEQAAVRYDEARVSPNDLGLATPVVLWAGWPFHRAAALNLRHRAVTMDTLVSLGTLAAWGWSVVALL